MASVDLVRELLIQKPIGMRARADGDNGLTLYAAGKILHLHLYPGSVGRVLTVVEEELWFPDEEELAGFHTLRYLSGGKMRFEAVDPTGRLRIRVEVLGDTVRIYRMTPEGGWQLATKWPKPSGRTPREVLEAMGLKGWKVV